MNIKNIFKTKSKLVKKVSRNGHFFGVFGLLLLIVFFAITMFYINERNRIELHDLKKEVSQLKEGIKDSKSSTSFVASSLTATPIEVANEPETQSQELIQTSGQLDWDSEEMQRKIKNFTEIAKAQGVSDEAIEAFLTRKRLGLPEPSSSMPSQNINPPPSEYDWEADRLKQRMDELEREQGNRVFWERYCSSSGRGFNSFVGAGCK